MSWATDIPDVVAGQPITSGWGNLIRDRVVHNVATVAALPATGMDNGEVAYVAADGLIYIRHAAKWWTRKSVSLAGKSTDSGGLVVITAADVGLVTITAGIAMAGHTPAVTGVAFSSSRVTAGPPVNIELRVWKLSAAAPANVQPATSQSLAVPIAVYVEGYAT